MVLTADDAVFAEGNPYEIIERRDLAVVGIGCVAFHRLTGLIGTPHPYQLHPPFHRDAGGNTRGPPRFIVFLTLSRELDWPEPQRPVAVDHCHQRAGPRFGNAPAHLRCEDVGALLNHTLLLVDKDLCSPPIIRAGMTPEKVF